VLPVDNECVTMKILIEVHCMYH